MRTVTPVGALTVAMSAALLIAPAAHATAPGDHGTVKIHEAITGEELRTDEPHVCTFYLDAFGFDSSQRVAWHIEAWGPRAGVKGQTVESGLLTLDAGGRGRSEDLTLPDGHYKLSWTFSSRHASAEHKVFRTECPQNKSKDRPTDDPSVSASASPTAAGDGTAGSGGLPETGGGAPAGVLCAVAAALLAAGCGLLFRRRRAGRG